MLFLLLDCCCYGNHFLCCINIYTIFNLSRKSFYAFVLLHQNRDLESFCDLSSMCASKDFRKFALSAVGKQSFSSFMDRIMEKIRISTNFANFSFQVRKLKFNFFFLQWFWLHKFNEYSVNGIFYFLICFPYKLILTLIIYLFFNL